MTRSSVSIISFSAILMESLLLLRKFLVSLFSTVKTTTTTILFSDTRHGNYDNLLIPETYNITTSKKYIVEGGGGVKVGGRVFKYTPPSIQ